MRRRPGIREPAPRLRGRPRTHRPEVETPKEGNAMADPVPSKARRSSVSRRSFLKTLGVAGAAGSAPAFLRSRAEAQETPARDPGAKRGGTLRYGVLSAPAPFHLHQSGTVSNTRAHAPLYDCLIRP